MRTSTTFGLLAIILGVVIAIASIHSAVVASYQIEKNYTNLWALADKSSTIPAKQAYIAQFVTALNAGNAAGDFATHDAMWLRTPNNSFAANLQAVTTLASRLAEIQRMNPTTFEYNTAIQQITAQEQGEAKAMISVFEGCYTLKSYPMAWGWIGALCGVGACVFIVGGIAPMVCDE